MSDGIFSKVLSQLAEVDSAKQSESFVMVNVRPGPKISAMIEIACHLNQKTPSVLMAEKLSLKLAAYAASSATHAPAVLEAAELTIESLGRISTDSALGLLEEAKLLQVRNPFMREFKF